MALHIVFLLYNVILAVLYESRQRKGLLYQTVFTGALRCMSGNLMVALRRPGKKSVVRHKVRYVKCVN